MKSAYDRAEDRGLARHSDGSAGEVICRRARLSVAATRPKLSSASKENRSGGGVCAFRRRLVPPRTPCVAWVRGHVKLLQRARVTIRELRVMLPNRAFSSDNRNDSVKTGERGPALPGRGSRMGIDHQNFNRALKSRVSSKLQPFRVFRRISLITGVAHVGPLPQSQHFSRVASIATEVQGFRALSLVRASLSTRPKSVVAFGAARYILAIRYAAIAELSPIALFATRDVPPNLGLQGAQASGAALAALRP